MTRSGVRAERGGGDHAGADGGGAGDVVKDVQNKSTLSVSDRAAIATYAICMNVASYADIPAALERFGSVVHSVGLVPGA